jgi:hypothetical protein
MSLPTLLDKRLALVLLLLCAVMSAAAQDTTPIAPPAATPDATAQPTAQRQLMLELTTTFVVQDLGFQFPSPRGWFSDTRGGVSLAETEADLAALTSREPTPPPITGLTIRLIALNGAQLEQMGVTPEMNLDTAVNTVLSTLQLRTLERFDLPMLARRAITVVSQADNTERAGIMSFFEYRDRLVMFVLSAPSMERLRELAYTWGVLLSNAKPVDTLALPTTIRLPLLNITIRHPQTWQVESVTGRAVSIIAENAVDIASVTGNTQKSIAASLMIVQFNLSNLQLNTSATAGDALEVLVPLLNFSNAVPTGEYLVAGVYGVGIRANTPLGDFVHVVVTVRDGLATAYIGTAPTIEYLTAFEPTYTLMLMSARAVRR